MTDARERRQQGVIPPMLTAWFSALLFFVVVVGSLGYLTGAQVIAPVFLDDGLARYGVGAVTALMSLRWAVGRWQVETAYRFFWRELAVYCVFLCQYGVVGTLGYLAGYFFTLVVFGDGWVGHGVGGVVALTFLRWLMKAWRTMVRKGEAKEMYDEAKDYVLKQHPMPPPVAQHFYLSHGILSARFKEYFGQECHGLKLWWSALTLVFFGRPGAKL